MRTIPLIAVIALVAAACGSTGTTLPPVPSTAPVAASSAQDETPESRTTVPATSTTTAQDTTTTTLFSRTAIAPTDAPPFEEVLITTEDDIDLYGEFWEGDDIAVIYTHEYDARANASSGVQRPPQSSATVAPNTWLLAEAGYTVLAIDFRNHGKSEGEYSVKRSQLDIKAAYEFLADRGYTTIVGMAQGGSAPVMADLMAKDEDFQLAGIGMLFTPLAETGFDAGQALSNIDEPVWLVGYDIGSFGGITKKLERKVENLYDRIIFPKIPSGSTFQDVHGEEWWGRQLAFIASFES